MHEHEIGSAMELFELLYGMKNELAWVFRGQRDAAWPLLPKAGRPDFVSKFSAGLSEKEVFDSWKRYAVHFLQQHHQYPQDEWDWMVLAQHHGLATRLLDWTKNPLNAAFFAVAKNGTTGCALYAFEIKSRFKVKDEGPFDIDSGKMKIYYPRGLSARIVSQRGIFTVTGDPATPLEDILDDRLHNYTIPPNAAEDIRRTLLFFGINEMSIYQDLDHLSRTLNEFVLS